MKNAAFGLVLLLCLFPGLQRLATGETPAVRPGEEATLTLKLVNVGDTALNEVRVQLEPLTKPSWIEENVLAHQAASVPAKTQAQARPSTRIAFSFSVAEDAPENTVTSIRLLIRDGQGHVWTQRVALRVAPRPKPDVSRLLQNYPNPFNPETWIPYQLEQSGEATIRIYDAKGRRVRTLELGHQSAGFYTSRSEAAYWDGRNATGERVASGLYFYQLQTESFAQMRRMLILK